MDLMCLLKIKSQKWFLPLLLCLGICSDGFGQESYPLWLTQMSNQINISENEWAIARALSLTDCDVSASARDKDRKMPKIIQGVYRQDDQYFIVHMSGSDFEQDRMDQNATAIEVMHRFWPALRDDMVKPFRSFSAHEQRLLPCSHAVEMFLNHEGIKVVKKFNRRDLDPQFALDNQSYKFNQTLKLKILHQAMDSLFLKGH